MSDVACPPSPKKAATPKKNSPAKKTPSKKSPAKKAATPKKGRKPAAKKSPAKKAAGSPSKRAAKKGGRKLKKNYTSWKSYIYLGVKDAKVGASGKGMAILDSMVKDLAQKIANESMTFARAAKRETIKDVDVVAAVKVVLPVGLAKNAAANIKSANYGLVFPIARSMKALRVYNMRVSRNAGRALAVALQTVCWVLVYFAAQHALASKKNGGLGQKRISPRSLVLACEHDKSGELKKLVGSAIASGGSVVAIQEALIPKKSKKAFQDVVVKM